MRNTKSTTDFETIKSNLLEYAKSNSTDAVTQVAACYYQAPAWEFEANKTDNIISITDVERRSKLFYATIQHAEIRLIKKLGCPQRMDGPVFTTCFPCSECQDCLYERGVRTIYYMDDHYQSPWSADAHRHAVNLGLNMIKI